MNVIVLLSCMHACLQTCTHTMCDSWRLNHFSTIHCAAVLDSCNRDIVSACHKSDTLSTIHSWIMCTHTIKLTTVVWIQQCWRSWRQSGLIFCTKVWFGYAVAGSFLQNAICDDTIIWGNPTRLSSLVRMLFSLSGWPWLEVLSFEQCVLA